MNHPSLNRLYIMTLGILAPFRGKGIGSKMLNKVMKAFMFFFIFILFYLSELLLPIA